MSDIETKRVGVTLTNTESGETIKLEPSINETETSGSGEIVTFTDQCGHEEADQTSAGNAQHAIDGAFYKNVVQTLYTWYMMGVKVDVTLPAEVDIVSLFITDITIKQTQESGVFVDRQGNEDKLVFPTQIQLKASGAIEESQ